MEDLIPRMELTFHTPLLNAAGTLGFSPNPTGPVDLSRLGAFVTNPVSLRARTPAEGPRLLPYPGGILLHTGHPNPGLRAVLRAEAPSWGRAALPVIVHLMAEDPAGVRAAVIRLEEEEGVAAVELGLPPEAGPQVCASALEAAFGELPVIARIPVDRVPELAPPLLAAGARLCSLGPPRGSLPGVRGEQVSGRLYGPALLPQALLAARRLVEAGFQVIGGGGVYRKQDVEAFLTLGCAAVQLDTVLWKNPDFLK